jgi:hypothetical protein
MVVNSETGVVDGSDKPDCDNPNLGDYLLLDESGLRTDLIGLFRGLGPSVISMLTLATVDSPEFVKRFIRNKVPIDLIKTLMDHLPAIDYHREGDPDLFMRPGFLTGAASAKYLGQAFPAPCGINSHQYDFSDGLLDLSDRLLPKVKKTKDVGKTVHFLGHSYGALIGLQAYQKQPKLFDRILTMAVPYHGSEMADRYGGLLSLLPIVDVRKFSTTDPVLAEFRRKGLPEDAPILNLYSDGDELIRHYSRSILPSQSNVTNLCIPGIKHNQFLYDPLVREIAKLFMGGCEVDSELPDRLDQALGPKQTTRIEELVRVNGF